ncbi:MULTISPECIES: pyridoxamine 5'-phosphate oxidase family protein [Parafrankia]|uniref:Pyridoxamine 5'-phosphate oxidase n=1 Tax=Parafrankia soli TaxID=2599596 RepID=A0A1S1PE36_9ACTN|nr:MULTISPECIES: pyridoxamine 5'-phosphate oxidase family protein [Parafrankia]OHV19576.1 pyridoxamine 5'-phosphate oxidase [Parafrankia soli]TCJ31907.1 pyridoxamine 5'-phosphate oxidase [Parafrankia sp. BMG5.11]CAI7974050.1 Pyridoxamine 5'-phosphate oxidase [Frankia sp. Hr75.2]SQE00211.1 Pyridoxamine 5'-phosphate oxidase-related FMN-binding [Parafrankia sp. Ea1.12]
MSIRLSEDEIWEFVSAAHTGVLTTLRADGAPVSLPTWFVVVDRTVCLSTPSGARKLGRVRRDPRAAFLVESGRAWAELRAVHLSGRVGPVEDDATRDRVRSLLDEKYAAFRVSPQRLPAAARSAYTDRAVLRLVPDERVLSWDNSRIRLSGG